MSAATIAANPPLPFTRDAIINQLRHQATNGPAYVQHGATKALAHLKGLYAEARYEARHAFDSIRDAAREVADQTIDQADDGKMLIGQRVAGLLDGSIQPTPEELAYLELDNPLDDDEDHPEENEDEPH